MMHQKLKTSTISDPKIGPAAAPTAGPPTDRALSMHPALSMLSACIQPSDCIQLYESMLVPALPAWAYTRALTFENPCRNSTTAATVRRKGKAAPGRRGVMGG